LLEKLTSYRRNKNLLNYQVSHIFDNTTKNPLLFECPWNVMFTPKIIDPFTGHETKGIWPKEFQKLIIDKAKSKYQKYISDYNQIISNLNIEKKLHEFKIKCSQLSYTEKQINEFEKGIRKNFQLIEL
jgi:hypothetical protein